VHLVNAFLQKKEKSSSFFAMFWTTDSRGTKFSPAGAADRPITAVSEDHLYIYPSSAVVNL
jgi:hypothetical protein